MCGVLVRVCSAYACVRWDYVCVVWTHVCGVRVRVCSADAAVRCEYVRVLFGHMCVVCVCVCAVRTLVCGVIICVYCAGSRVSAPISVAHYIAAIVCVVAARAQLRRADATAGPHSAPPTRPTSPRRRATTN